MEYQEVLSLIGTSNSFPIFEDAYRDFWELSSYLAPLATLKLIGKWRLPTGFYQLT